jgi:hypothetical protein
MIVDHESDRTTPPDRLVIYTVFDRPGDHPDAVIVTRDVIEAGAIRRLPHLWSFPDVASAGGFLAGLGLHRQDRAPGDVPAIVEVWF